jgi:hypothetical protein
MRHSSASNEAGMNSHEQNRPAFKGCPMCGFQWQSRARFLSDPRIEIIGYQACFEELTAGFFLFNHSCAGTLAVLVEEFEDLYDGPVYEERKTGTDECLQYCLRRNELALCPARCECAFVREIIQIVRQWPKSPAEHMRPLQT